MLHEIYTAALGWEPMVFLSSDLNSMECSLFTIYIHLVFTIPNMFEWVYVRGAVKIYKMLRKKATSSLRVRTLYYFQY